MPISDPRQYAPVLEAVLRREPHSVLDVGIGHGLYGGLLRAHLPPPLRLIGVEPYTAYGGGWWDAYDGVIEETWPTRTITRHEPFDMALCIDVIEHVVPEARADFLEAIMGWSRCLVMATPHHPERFPQDDLANPLEKHHEAYRLPVLTEHLTWMIPSSVMVECHWLPDSYIAVIEK